MESTQLTPEMLALVPIVAGVLQALKKIPIIDKIKAYMPFLSMALGLGAVYALTGEPQVIPAVVMGLMASGLYSGVKALGKANGV